MTTNGSFLTVVLTTNGSFLTVVVTTNGSFLTVAVTTNGSFLTVVVTTNGSFLTVVVTTNGSFLTVVALAALSQRRSHLQQLRSQMQSLRQTVADREVTLTLMAQELVEEIANVTEDAPPMRLSFNAAERTERTYASVAQVTCLLICLLT